MLKRVIAFWMIGLMFLTVPSGADIVMDEETEDEVIGRDFNPLSVGKLEVRPIMSVRMSRNSVIYQAGVSVGYSLTRSHQVGGSFVMGNRAWNRANRREIPTLSSDGTRGIGASSFSVDDGFGSSVTGFYRYNVPYEVQRRVFPFVEAFGGRDFWGWGNVSEVGGGVGVRKVVSRSAALTTQYSFVALFTEGQRFNRHIVTAGISMFFR